MYTLRAESEKRTPLFPIIPTGYPHSLANPTTTRTMHGILLNKNNDRMLRSLNEKVKHFIRIFNALILRLEINLLIFCVS